jgi:hypothetical protein
VRKEADKRGGTQSSTRLRSIVTLQRQQAKQRADKGGEEQEEMITNGIDFSSCYG